MSEHLTFIHAADLHLDAPFKGVVADNETVGKALVEATYRAFESLIDVCVERQVDFLVLAGDTYDNGQGSLRARSAFRRGMERLAQAGIEVFLVHGNHDPATGRAALQSLPENVRVFGTGKVERFEFHRDGRLTAAVYGRSFAKPAELSNFASGYVRDESDPVAIGVLHANVGGNPDYDPYAPASMEDLRAARMDYWALGHIHKREVLSDDPWVVYAGSPQGLNPKEIGDHGCTVVEMSPGGAITAEHVELAPVAWSRAAIDVSACETIDEVRDLVAERCRELLGDSGRNTVARISVTGRTHAHAEMTAPGNRGRLLDDLRSDLMDSRPWMWLDRLGDETGTAIDIDQLRAGSDFASELVAVTDELLADPQVLDAMIAELSSPLAEKLAGYAPRSTAAETLERARDIALDQLLAQGGDV